MYANFVHSYLCCPPPVLNYRINTHKICTIQGYAKSKKTVFNSGIIRVKIRVRRVKVRNRVRNVDSNVTYIYIDLSRQREYIIPNSHMAYIYI